MPELNTDYFGYVRGSNAKYGHGHASVARCKGCGAEFRPHPLSSLKMAMRTHSTGSCDAPKFEVE